MQQQAECHQEQLVAMPWSWQGRRGTEAMCGLLA
jgi:hypothetical protein